MSIYTSAYNIIVERGRQRKNEYGPGSGLHCHHIIPKHSGGTDLDENYTYLTVNEHILAHWLLYKIYGKIQDLRSKKMLGGKLSVTDRRKIGIWCYENGIGFHKHSSEKRAELARNSWARDKERLLQYGFHNAPKHKKIEWASKAGKASHAAGGTSSRFDNMPPEKLIEIAKKGSAIAGKVPVTDGTKTIKLKSREDRDIFLKENPDWRAGMHWKKKAT